MDLNKIKKNAKVLHAEMQWLAQIIDIRMKLYWKQNCNFTSISEYIPPNIEHDDTQYAQIIKYYQLGFQERVILLLGLAPHIMPQLLDVFFVKNADYDRGFTEFGGLKGQNHSGFMPTGETAAFILSAADLESRLNLLHIFSDDHVFKRFNILKLLPTNANEPFLSGLISLSFEFINYFTLGHSHQPDFNANFPAKRILTERVWEDLILEEHILDEVLEICDWIRHGSALLNDWGMKGRIKPGFRSLFYGPPGTGKTMTASLIGKATGLEVYRIDLSMVVSKYIGETEKNLSSVFDQAEHKNWILFFDEADALFGKRTQTSSSNDRYANQEVSYLLQRIEDFPGVTILATNLKANLDEAFSRRFQSMIYFPVPGNEQRKKIWLQSFSSKSVLDSDIDIDKIAEKFELSGGAIINVTRYCSLQALKRGDHIISKRDLLTGIKREFFKEGKIVSHSN